MRLKHPRAELEEVGDLDIALLVLVRSHHRDNGISGYEIVRLKDQGTAGLLGRSSASVYGHLRRLADNGFLTSEQVPGRRGRDATKYTLTRKGNEALLVWLDTSVATLPALDDSDLFLRIRAARIPGLDKPISKGLGALAWDIVDWRMQLDHEEQELRREGTWTVSAATRLEFRLMRTLLDAYDGWIAEVQRELPTSNLRR